MNNFVNARSHQTFCTSTLATVARASWNNLLKMSRHPMYLVCNFPPAGTKKAEPKCIGEINKTIRLPVWFWEHFGNFFYTSVLRVLACLSTCVYLMATWFLIIHDWDETMDVFCPSAWSVLCAIERLLGTFLGDLRRIAEGLHCRYVFAGFK